MANNEYNLSELFGQNTIEQLYIESRMNSLNQFVQNLPNPNPTVEDEYQSFQRLITLLYPDPSQIPPTVQNIQTDIQTLVQSYKKEDKVIKDLDLEIQQKQKTIAELRILNQPTTAQSP